MKKYIKNKEIFEKMQNLAAKQHRNDPKIVLEIFKFSFWAEGFDKENEVSLGFKIPMSYTSIPFWNEFSWPKGFTRIQNLVGRNQDRGSALKENLDSHPESTYLDSCNPVPSVATSRLLSSVS